MASCRLSKIEVYPEHLAEYLACAIEVDISPYALSLGVSTVHAIQEKDGFRKIMILETHVSQTAYKLHIISEEQYNIL